MNIRKLTDEEADAMWELGVPLLKRFTDGGDDAWVKHWRSAGSPADDRLYYLRSGWWEFGVEIE